MGKVDVSAIVVSFGAREELKVCLEALGSNAQALLAFHETQDHALSEGEGAKHETRKLEVLVIDNASPDGSAQMVDSLFPKVRLIANRVNYGFATAVNQGFSLAQGRYALVVNPDCHVSPEAIQTMIRFGDAHPDVGVIGPQLLNLDGSLQPSGRRFPSVGLWLISLLGLSSWVNAQLLGWGRDYSQSREVEEVSGAAMLVRREAWESVGGMDGGFFLYYEDVDFCRRVRQSGWRIVYLPAARVRHAWASTTNRFYHISHPASVHGACRYFRKHHGLFAASVVRFALVLREMAHISLSLFHPHKRRLLRAHMEALRWAMTKTNDIAQRLLLCA